MKPCYARLSEVTLLDGNKYKFRALPYNRTGLGIIGRVINGSGDFAQAAAFLDAIELSLSYDQEPETVAAILDSGAIPFAPGAEGSREHEIHGAIIRAMAFAGTK